MDAFYTVLLRFPKLALVGLFALVLYFSSFIPQLKIDASSDSLVLEGDSALQIYREAVDTFGTSDFLFLAFTPHEHLYSEGVRQTVEEMSEKFSAIEGVGSVLSYLDVPLLYSPMVSISTISDGVKYLNDEDLNISLAQKEFLQSPIYSDLLTSADEKTLAIQVNIKAASALIQLRERVAALEKVAGKQEQQTLLKLRQELEAAKQERLALEKQLVADVRQVLDEYQDQGNIFIGGVPMIVSDMLSYVRSDMVVFGSAILLFIVVVLALIFRQLRWVLLPLLTCLSTCLLMLGLIAFFGVKLTVISANFVALLLIITLSITIHLAVRYLEYEADAIDKDGVDEINVQALVKQTMQFMFKPCAYTTLTTMVAFMSLVVSGIRPVIDFGWMMSAALAMALCLAFVILPLGLVLTKPAKRLQVDNAFSRFTSHFAELVERYSPHITFISLALLVFSLTGLAQLKVENRFIDYFDESTDIYQGMSVIDEQLGGTLPLDIVLYHEQEQLSFALEPSEIEAGDAEDDFFEEDDFFSDDGDSFASEESSAYANSYWFSRAGLAEINKVHQFIDAMEGSGKVLSLATLYQVVKDITEGQVDDIQLAIIKEKATGVIADALITPYLSADGTQTRLSIRVMETSKALNRSEMLAQIEAFLLQDMGYKKEGFELTGVMVMYNNMLQSLYTSQITTLGAVFVAIMLMFLVLFRSLPIALIAIAPNILAALFVLGTMGWLGIPLDIMTITIAAITIGIGVDDTIHYVHRFGRELKQDGDYRATMHRCHASIGRAMFYTSFTIIAGFSILSLSNFTPSIYFGVLTGLAMFAALLGALLVLPLLLLKFKPFNLAAA